MPIVSVIQPCYDVLYNIKGEMIADKKARGQPTATTFSECICMLIKEYRKNHNYSAEMLGSGSGEYLIKNITAPGSASSSQKSQSLEV